jgi:dipeptidyl aminopeptidase/acylaminoacyl peptidase
MKTMVDRTKATLALAVLLLAPLAVPVGAQEGDIPLEGHVIEGDTLTFAFDTTWYPKIKYKTVSVRGNFNDYDSKAPDWQLADDDGDGVWTLEVPLGEGIKAGTPFSFVINGAARKPPAGVDPDFIVTDNDGADLLVVGGLKNYLANDPIASQLERQTFVDEVGGELDYYLHVPENYDPAQSYPLVLSLHGAGERGDNANPILPYNGAYEFLEGAANYDYFMLVPQAPRDRWWWEIPIRESIFDLIAATQEEYPIDPARIYIIGLSLGGYGLWDQVSHAPDLYAAGLSVCGGTPEPPIDAAPIAHIPFWLFHGANDLTVPRSESRNIVRALEDAGATVKFTLYEDAQHWIWVRTYTNPEVIDWLFSQVKS